jgi:hypothetical protein
MHWQYQQRLCKEFGPETRKREITLFNSVDEILKSDRFCFWMKVHNFNIISIVLLSINLKPI